MATLECRRGNYRVIFYAAGERFSRSLKTKRRREAADAVARLEDNLRRVELGILAPPADADLPTFLLSDGRVTARLEVPEIRTLQALFENYFRAIPAGSLEENTRRGMQTHVKHLQRIIGRHANVHAMQAADLQTYIERRSHALGLHGRLISAATIKKEIITLRTVWNWSFHMGVLKRPFPGRGLRYPKLEEKPPFQTMAEITRRIERGGLTAAEEADLWDAAFLTLPEIAELLAYVKEHARQPFIYPMFAFAAHTGARRSEMLRSQLTDIDLDLGTVLLHERKRVRGKHSTRRVPLSPTLIAILREWLDRHPGGTQTFCLSLDVARSKKERIAFEPLSIDETHDHFKRTLKDSKWARLRGWHVFRHSFCSNCAAKGLDQRMINAWVGHQTEEMVKRYRHLIPNQERDAKRKGAVCAYLETWHLDIEEFLDLRKNTGDDRRRTHDMHTANWIPDVFMKRVQENGHWTLFSPDEVPDLHDLYGKAFEDRYVRYEQLADAGELKLHRRVPANELWRKMLTRLFETGHPWITFKDPSNVRSPQNHVGVVHSSNLCTEILLNTSEDETAVCNLGSVNLAAHLKDGALDVSLLQETVSIAVRMLDNVIDINYYPTPEAANSNRRHRPIGLGIMGFQDALQALGLSFASEAAVEFADRGMEAVSYFALLASAELARQRGRYESYTGSKWDLGQLPIDTLDVLEAERGAAIAVDRSSTMEWQTVRETIAAHGMRNSNVLAIAPTATISTIIGVSQSIEPSYKYLYVKSNLSGEFTQINETLVDELKRRDLWDDRMLEELKYYDGSLQNIGRIPADLRERYLTAFEVDPKWLIECAARRQKWIDQGQSLNLYMADPSGRKLHEMYFLAWQKGLKTTYYLRTLAATQVEKSTVDVNRFGIQPKWMKNRSASSDVDVQREELTTVTVPKACRLDDPDCEACQ